MIPGQQNTIEAIQNAITNGQYETALNLAEDLIRRRPDSREVQKLYAEVLFMAGKMDELYNLIKGLKDLAHLSDLILAFAKFFYAEKRPLECLDLLIEAQRLRPDDPEVMLYIGLCHYCVQSYDLAYQYLKAGLSSPEAILHRANYLLALIASGTKRDFKSAYDFFTKSLYEANADRNHILSLLGYIDYAMGNYHTAISHFNLIDPREKDNGRLCYFRAMTNIMVGNQKGALRALDTFIESFGPFFGLPLIKDTLLKEGSSERIRGFVLSENPSEKTERLGAMLAQYAREIDPVIKTFRDNWHLSNLLNELDGLIIYYLIRQLKPKNVIEFSPYRGCSTVYIYKALQKNCIPFSLATFDISQCPEFTECMGLLDIPLSVTTGDALHTVPKYIRKNGLEGKIDLCLVDSDHSYEFAKTYIEKIFPLLGKDCVILIHDLYYSPNNFDLPFDHYAPIRSGNICENPASIGEARAVREFFRGRNDYVLYSTHRLFGGVADCSPLLPLNVPLLIKIGLEEYYYLERGRYWSQSPMCVVAVPKGINDPFLV
jgi:predicted O-methyltransferase YrrM/Flp pilus assembly protein TadD